MSNIVVNATASRTSGALSILKQFLTQLQVNNEDFYYIFIADSVYLEPIESVSFIHMDTRSWIKRIWWDEFGLQRWLLKNNVIPDLFISFQNTGIKYDQRTPQLIYYHNVIPLLNIDWRFWKRNELLFFLYQRIYPFFVKRSLGKSTYVAVQLPSTKIAFINKFNFSQENLFIVRPDLKRVVADDFPELEFDDNCFHFIYPATPFLYKNHLDVVHGLSVLRSIDKDLCRKIKVHFTLKAEKKSVIVKTIKKMKLEENFIFEGEMPFEHLMSYYKSMTALLFPSYIESFGLPLLEAANFGLPIIVSDLPYARDVVGRYGSASFVKLHDYEAWAKAIQQVCTSKKEKQPFIQNEEEGWLSFFNVINKIKLINNAYV